MSLGAQANQESEGAIKPIRAQIKSKSQATLSAGINASISHIHVRTGDYVKKGALLVEFTCDRYKAALDITNASVDASRAKYQSAEQLLSFNSIGPLEIELTKADLNKALGEQKSALADTRACEIVSPYNAIIVKRFAQPHQYINLGEPLLELYSPDALEIQLVVPSVWLHWLKKGQKFQAKFDELDEKFSGEIDQLGGAVDPVSQTVEVFGRLNLRNQNKSSDRTRVILGMSGWVTFHSDDSDEEL